MSGRHRSVGVPIPPPHHRRAVRPPRVQLRRGALCSTLAVVVALTVAALNAAARAGVDLAADDVTGRPGTTSVPVALTGPGVAGDPGTARTAIGGSSSSTSTPPGA